MDSFWIVYLVTVVVWVLVFLYGAYEDYKNNSLNWYEQYCEFNQVDRKYFWYMIVLILFPVVNTFLASIFLKELISAFLNKDNQ